MTKILNGQDLADYIKQRQARAARSLKQGSGVTPKLAIVQVKDDPVINTYVRLKKRYGQELGIEVESFHPKQSEVPALLKTLNKDDSVHGIIIQLPLLDPSETDKIVNLVSPEKDVDALAAKTDFDPATPTAILWLLSGYNIDLKDKHILLIGHGKLVGEPLEKMLKQSGIDVIVADRSTKNLSELTLAAEIIVTAAGSPAILYPEMIKQGAVIVDAGVATEDGKTVGDLAPSVYDRDDLIITPPKGGVGPLTVCSLFENVIKAANRSIKN
jgi:methylenetetrahydrofolate dehydrogenase (NADP+)/methenyltetrahydrofolate cyclohydrolase